MEYEWFEWDGRGFPAIKSDRVIEAKFRDGSTDSMEAGAFYWQFNWADCVPAFHDIVAFRNTDWKPEFQKATVPF